YRNPIDFDTYETLGKRRRSGCHRLKYQTCTPSTSTGSPVGTSSVWSRLESEVKTVTSCPRLTSASASEDTERTGPPILQAGLYPGAAKRIRTCRSLVAQRRPPTSRDHAVRAVRDHDVLELS